MNEVTIISDIHLGSHVCNYKNVQSFLDQLNTKILVINGDLFDSWDFRRLKKNHWKILEKLRQLSKKTKVIWITGNHDGPAELISHLIGIEFLNEYIFHSENKKIIILHGDLFDDFISKYPKFTKFVDYFYRFIQKIDQYWNTGYFYSKWAKRSSKTFLRCSELVADRAIDYCKNKKCNSIICGHTHLCLTKTKDNVTYYNSGCWTEANCSYITINSDKININNFEQQIIEGKDA